VIFIFFLTFIAVSLHGSSFEELKNKHNIKHIHYLTYHNNIEELTKLLSEDTSSINHQDAHGNTPLHYAAYYNRKSIVKLMLENNVSVDIPNALGDTPLFLATAKNNQDVMMLLCEHDADINKKNKWGNSPFNFSNQHNKEILESADLFNSINRKPRG